MKSVYIMLAVALVLFIYQYYFRNDDDELDSRGRPKRRR